MSDSSPVERVRDVLAASARDAVVLTRPSTVAWVTDGANSPIDRTAALDVIWAVITADSAVLITTDVEYDRVVTEALALPGLFTDVVSVPWWDEQQFVHAASGAARTTAEAMASDGHAAFGVDLDDALTQVRMVLTSDQRQELMRLGHDSADALQTALRSWSPGETDHDVQARLVALLEQRGADTPVVIVGGDDRVRKFRHPVAVGTPMRSLVMAVVVARRRGLHVAATRMATCGPIAPEFAALTRRARRIEARTVAATSPGSTYGDVLLTLESAYADEGFAGEWRRHYQGGPIGYRQREFEIAPTQRDSIWWRLPVEEGHAVAWNPSLTGGAKVEDTYLIGAGAPVRVTEAPGWPVCDGGASGCPAILEVD